MRTSGWTRLMVPNWADQTVYIVENDFARRGPASVETDSRCADLEATIESLLEGQFSNPIRIIAFNKAEGWSQNESEDLTQELRRWGDLKFPDAPSLIQDFVEYHEGHLQLALRLA